MTSTCSVEDVVDAADGWHPFGTECPKEEIVFLCQVVILYTVIVVSSYNLTVGHGDSTLWTALLSSSLGYLLPNPSMKREDGRLSFISFYRVIHRWLRTRTIRCPFNAKNNAINFLAVHDDGRQVPAKSLQPNFETGSYIRSYVNLFSATGKQAHDEWNGMSRDEFGKSYTFFGFDLNPTVATVAVSI